MKPTFFALVSATAFAASIGHAQELPRPEALTPPRDLELATGSGIVAAGGGLHTQPAFLTLHVPGEASVEQVLLYWHGLAAGADEGDDTALINGIEVRGTQVGESTLFFRERGIYPRYSIAYRADITELGLIRGGDNIVVLDGLDFLATNGGGVVVIYDDGSEAIIDLREGADNAFADFAVPLDTTIEQDYEFEPSELDRQSEILFMVSGVAHRSRPAAVSVRIDDGPAGILFDKVRSRDFLEWDTYVLPLTIPAGAQKVSVRLLSTPELPTQKPASLTWIASALVLPEPYLACDGTPKFWSQHPELWTGYSPADSLASTFITQSTALLPVYADLLGDLSLNETLVAPAGIAPLGPARELLREGTAALLNARSPVHAYPFPAELLTDAVNMVLATYDLGVYQFATQILRTWNRQACADEQVEDN